MTLVQWRQHKAMLREIAAGVEAAYRSPFQVGDEVITNVQMYADHFEGVMKAKERMQKEGCCGGEFWSNGFCKNGPWKCPAYGIAKEVMRDE